LACEKIYGNITLSCVKICAASRLIGQLSRDCGILENAAANDRATEGFSATFRTVGTLLFGGGGIPSGATYLLLLSSSLPSKNLSFSLSFVGSNENPVTVIYYKVFFIFIFYIVGIQQQP
jgi:hypothetical protein